MLGGRIGFPLPAGYDHRFMVDGTGFRRYARVDHLATGRRVEVWLTGPACQFYTGAFLPGTEGGGCTTRRRACPRTPSMSPTHPTCRGHQARSCAPATPYRHHLEFRLTTDALRPLRLTASRPAAAPLLTRSSPSSRGCVRHGPGLPLFLFADEGAKVAVTDLSRERVDAVVDRIRARPAARRTASCKLDVTDADAIVAAVEEIRTELGPIDVVVNNADSPSAVCLRTRTSKTNG